MTTALKARPPRHRKEGPCVCRKCFGKSELVEAPFIDQIDDALASVGWQWYELRVEDDNHITIKAAKIG